MELQGFARAVLSAGGVQIHSATIFWRHGVYPLIGDPTMWLLSWQKSAQPDS